jgi:hypothetical protein|tara:strand:- start:2229 stop:2924 length:696 start_codon:yes stop_codon:yes gene_type:complete
MSTWFFGATSDWSQRIISQLEGTVESFGREASPYKNIKQVFYHPDLIQSFIHKELEPLSLPDTIIFNINTGMVKELISTEEHEGEMTFETYNEWWVNNRDQLWFKTYLTNWLTLKGWKGNICYITSQIAADHRPKFAHLHMYKNLRALDYEIIWNNRNNDINAYGICPASNAEPMDWADYIVSRINDGDLGKGGVDKGMINRGAQGPTWLYGVAFDGDDFRMVEWKDYQKW